MNKPEEEKETKNVWKLASGHICLIVAIVLVIIAFCIMLLWKLPKMRLLGGKRKWGGRGGNCGCMAGMSP